MTMEEYTEDIKNLLIEKLEKKGIEQNIIPRFIKDLLNSEFNDPAISLYQVNNHLHLLGWEDVQLDYHTSQLAIAYLEDNRLTNLYV